MFYFFYEHTSGHVPIGQSVAVSVIVLCKGTAPNITSHSTVNEGLTVSTNLGTHPTVALTYRLPLLHTNSKQVLLKM